VEFIYLLFVYVDTVSVCRVIYFRVSVPCRPDLMVKKLRYYARFIVVCLLLKKMKLVRDLVRVRDLVNEGYFNLDYLEDYFNLKIIFSQCDGW